MSNVITDVKTKFKMDEMIHLTQTPSSFKGSISQLGNWKQDEIKNTNVRQQNFVMETVLWKQYYGNLKKVQRRKSDFASVGWGPETETEDMENFLK